MIRLHRYARQPHRGAAERVLLALRAFGPSTIARLNAAFRQSPHTLRSHLDRLVDDRLVVWVAYDDRGRSVWMAL